MHSPAGALAIGDCALLPLADVPAAEGPPFPGEPSEAPAPEPPDDDGPRPLIVALSLPVPPPSAAEPGVPFASATPGASSAGPICFAIGLHALMAAHPRATNA